MKALILLIMVFAILQSCRSGVDAEKLANDVCDCFKKEVGMTSTDTTAVSHDCMKLQLENARMVEHNKKKWDAYNKLLADCSKELGRPVIP